MTRTAPKPANFTAMANAWDDPVAFARELDRYYAQLAADRSAEHVDITQPRHRINEETE